MVSVRCHLVSLAENYSVLPCYKIKEYVWLLWRVSAFEGFSMSFRSLAFQRFAVSLAAIFLVSACTDNGRATPLSGVEVIDIPTADLDNQANQNIANPTLTIPATFEVSPGDALTMVWSEEFDGPSIDPEVWFFEAGDGEEYGLLDNGDGAWGNNELQWYLPDSAMVVNGVLEITARREIASYQNYTSARINTRDRFAVQYGRVEASIKLPSGQGLWPAFWMLSQDSPYGEWAATGEIDIVEAINLDGSGSDEIFGTIHYGGEFPANTSSSETYTPSVDVTEDFHTYAIEWDANEIRWYFDDTLYAMQNSWFSTAAPFPAPFDQPFHIILNLAVGGNFPGSPDGTTPFPATMEVDWVRVYSGEEAPFVPADPGTIPDDVIYATDPAETVDLVFGVDYTGFDPFSSGSVFNNDITTDADFSPAFGVTTGDGYGAQVGQFAIVGWSAGFASGYATLDFKAKGLNNDLIRIKFLDDPNYLDVTLTSSSYSTDLGNGWYQVSIPITAFTGVATATGMLFETDDTAANSFTFLLTDIGFSGTAGGGGGGGTFVNGDFETGDFTGWTLTQDPTDRGSIALDSSGQGGRAGTVARLVAAGDAAGTNDVLISQVALAAGTVAPGDSIDVSFDLYGSLTGAGGVVFVEVIFLNGAGQDEGGRNFVGPAAPYVPSTTWTTHSGTVIAGTAGDGSQWDVSGGVTLELKAACGAIAGGCGVDASFDNVTFTIN